MKKLSLLLVLITAVSTLKVTAQRSKNGPTPIYSTKIYQQEEKNLDLVSKWLAWGTGNDDEDYKMIKRQDTTVDPMTTKEFPRGVMPSGKDVVMLKADAFNLAQMNNFFGTRAHNADKMLSKEKPNLFLFRHGYYFTAYNDVREAYYFDYHAYPLTAKDPILKKNGCKVFWIKWESITKEVKPIDTAAITAEKHRFILSEDENSRYLKVLNAAAATLEDKYQGQRVYMETHGLVNHLTVEKEGHSGLGDHIASMEFYISPNESNLARPSECVTFLYDHKTRKGTILWITTHGKIKYHTEEETKQKIDQLIAQLDTFI